MALIRIKGTALAKPTLFAALFNAAAPCGMGWLRYDPQPISKPEGAQFIPANGKIDIFEGRQLFLDLSGDEFDPTEYNTANVSGLAEFVIANFIKQANVYDGIIAKCHGYNLERQAVKTLEQIDLARNNFDSGSLDVGLLFASKRIEIVISQVMSRYKKKMETPKKNGEILKFTAP